MASDLFGRAYQVSDSDLQSEDEGRVTSVFFSYSRADQARALPIIRALEDAGYCVWWDGVLEGGVRYIESTEEALKSARAVVVLWSNTSVKSHWVQDEAMHGRDGDCLVPLSIEGAEPPLGFRQFQVIDMANWRGAASAPEIQNLIRTVAALHDREVPDFQVQPSRALAWPGLSRRQLIWYGMGAAAVAGGGLTLGIRAMGGPGKPSATTIAVMPFENDSLDPEQDYLSDGLATELRSSLARNQALRVVARSSSERVKEQKLDAVSVARELGVAFVVEGAVRVSGDLVRVSSDLIEGKTGIGRWSETYNQSVDGLLSLQQELANAISSALSLEVSSAIGQADIGAATNPAAFDSYLRGWMIFRGSNNTETDLQALARFDRAVVLDPGFAAAHAARSATLTLLGNTADDAKKAQAYYRDAHEAAQLAVSLGPDLDDAHSALALVLFETQLKVREAREPYERSLELGQGSAAVQARYAEYSALTGQHNAALKAIRFGLELDPLNPTIFRSAGLVHYAAGRYAQSIEMNQEALDMHETISDANAWIGYAHFHLGRIDQAIEAALREPFTLMSDPCLAICYAQQGRTAEAEAMLAKLIEAFGNSGLYQQAQVLAQWNRGDAAMTALSKAREIGDAGLTYLRMDPFLNPLRSRPDFITLQTDLGFT